MKELTLYWMGAGLTVVISSAVVAYLRPHLGVLLVDLCGTPERAKFWAAFSNVTLMLAPLIFALHFEPADSERAFGLLLGAQLKQALVGLLVSVLVLGTVLSMFISRTGTVAKGT